jgi:hypothetical protein
LQTMERTSEFFFFLYESTLEISKFKDPVLLLDFKLL